MKTKPNLFAALAATAALWAMPATAAVVRLNFDSFTPNAGNGTAFLNSIGITLTNVTPSGPAGVVDIYNYSGPGSLWLDDNFLQQSGAGAVPCSYTMNFPALQSIRFERIATPPNLSTEPQWSATAYAGAVAVGTVGESLNTWGNSPAKSFTLTGNGITSLTISANGFGFTAIGSVPLDNFVLTQVPEPSTITLAALGLISLGFVALRQKFRRA